MEQIRIKSLGMRQHDKWLLSSRGMIFAVEGNHVQSAIAKLRRELKELDAKFKRNTFHGKIYR